MPAFEITFSEPFLIEMCRRHRRCRTLARHATFLKAILGLCLLALIAVCIAAKAYPAAPILAVFLALLAFAHRIDEWLVGRRFRKSPYHNERIRIQLSPGGFTADGTKSNAHLRWTVFTAVRRFDDGWLLFQGPGAFNWLPCRALVQGSAEEIEELIRANVADYKRI